MNKKTNIIFYFSDQQRFDTINGEIMPNLSDFAENGITYSNNFTCQPVCGPARACLQSGEYATKNGSVFNGIALDRTIKPLAAYLKENGYDTAYIGKWHLGSDRIGGVHCEKSAIPKERLGGYDYFRGADVLEFTSHGYGGYVFDENGKKYNFDGYRSDEINKFAIEYLEKHNGEKPFFMFVSQLEPHHQNDHNRFECPLGADKKFADYPIPEDLTFLKGNYEKSFAAYLGCINRLDENLAELVKTLKNKGIFEDTVIIYTSDHGCHFRTRNIEYKRSPHDSATHTPLVIFGGRFKGKEINDKLVSLIDLPPTILGLAGIEKPCAFQGIDIFGNEERKNCFIQISESQVGRAIRTKDYLYSVRAVGMPFGYIFSKAKIYFEDYLYDVNADRSQKYNLIKDKKYKAVRKELRQSLTEEMVKAGEKKPIILKALFRRNK